MTPATLKLKDVPKDPESSKVATARAKASAPPAQELAVTASESHEEYDELVKIPAATQAKETQDDVSTKKAVLDP